MRNSLVIIVALSLLLYFIGELSTPKQYEDTYLEQTVTELNQEIDGYDSELIRNDDGVLIGIITIDANYTLEYTVKLK